MKNSKKVDVKLERGTFTRRKAGFTRLRMPIVSLSILFCLAHVIYPESAHAGRKRVTITGFQGPGAGPIRSYVIRTLKRDHDLVPIATYVKTAKKLRVKVTGPANVRRICEEAEIDAVVFGRILRSRGRWWLRLSVNDGATGEQIERSVIRLVGPRLDSSSRYSVRMTLKKAMNKVEGVSARAPEPEPEPEVYHEPEVVEETEPEVKVRRKRRPAGPRPPWVTVFEGGLMLDVVGRKFVVNPTADNPDYRTRGIVPTPGFWFEMYPGAFVTNQRFLSAIGLGFNYSRSFGVTSSSEDIEEDVNITTTYQKTDFYFVFRFNILQTEKSPELRLALGLGNLRFMFSGVGREFDSVKALGVNYWYFKPRLAVRVPLALERLSFVFNFAALLPFQKGPVEDWWAYGETKAWGLEIQGGLDIRIHWRVHALLLGQYSHFGLTFLQDGIEGHDYVFTGSTAVDRYYGLIFGVGVKYF